MAGPGHKPRVLIVDDDELIVRMICDLLSAEFEVLSATAGAEAVQILEREPVAAILCDQNMPGILGIEVLERAITLQPRAVRILVTATDKVEDVADATNRARVHRVVVKPVREVEIARLVRGAIHEMELEEENARLVGELQAAVAELQQREKELERELLLRNEELRAVIAQLRQ